MQEHYVSEIGVSCQYFFNVMSSQGYPAKQANVSLLAIDCGNNQVAITFTGVTFDIILG